jgi:Na+-driven multidrug efflux pump
LYLIPNHLATVLFAIGAGDTEALRSKLRFTLKVSALVGVPAIVVLELAAPLILRPFGAVYADSASGVLRILALAYLPTVLKTHYISVIRVQKRLVLGAAVTIGGAVLEIALAAIGGIGWGIAGLAWGLLIALCIEGVVTGPTVFAAAYGRSPAQRLSAPVGGS